MSYWLLQDSKVPNKVDSATIKGLSTTEGAISVPRELANDILAAIPLLPNEWPLTKITSSCKTLTDTGSQEKYRALHQCDCLLSRSRRGTCCIARNLIYALALLVDDRDLFVRVVGEIMEEFFFFPASALWPVWPGQSTVSVGRKLYRSI